MIDRDDGLRTFLFSERPELRKRRGFSHGTRKCTDRQLGTRQLPLRLFRLRGLRSKLGTNTMIDRDDGLRTFLFSERPELRKRRGFSHGTRKCTDRQLGTRQLPLRLFRLRGLRSKLGTNTMIDRDDGLR